MLLVAADPAQLAQLATLPALAGCVLHGSTLADLTGAASLRDWLAQHLGRDVGDYPLPPGFAYHRLWQCGQRMRQAALATGLISLLAGAGLFGYSDYLRQLSHTLQRRSHALEQADQQRSQQLPACCPPCKRASTAWTACWPCTSTGRATPTTLGACPPCWPNCRAGVCWRCIGPSHFRRRSDRKSSLRLTLTPATEADYRHSVQQLEHALASQRRQGVSATLIQAPHDIQPDGTLRPERAEHGRFVLQLTLPSLPRSAP